MKKLLVIIDCQKDFVSGSLGFDGADKIMDNIAKKAESFDGDIAFTMDTHSSEYKDTREGKNLPVIHCQKGTEGWQIVDKLQKFTENAVIFEKQTFGSYDFLEFLKKSQYDQITLTGVVTNICVISNAVMALTALPYAEIIVDAACVGGGDDVTAQKALDVMESIHIKVINR